MKKINEYLNKNPLIAYALKVTPICFLLVSILFNISQKRYISYLEMESNTYRNYYIQAEFLLDSLEYDYNWVDSRDPQLYYQAVDSVHQLDAKWEEFCGC